MGSLKQRFEEIIHLQWGEFLKLELDKSSSVDDVVLCSLVRACTDTDDIASIKLAFDRIDGLLETLIEIKVPKFYTRYVRAKDIAIEAGAQQLKAPDNAEEESSKYDPATAKLRDTLKEMRAMPRDVIRVVLLYKKRLEKGVPVETEPTVKAVIVANLLKHVKKGRFSAIELVFNQIDGKLPKSINLLGGDDVYVDDYTTLTAPPDAQLGEDGVYFAENQMITNIWLRGFAQSQKGLEILAEGLSDD